MLHELKVDWICGLIQWSLLSATNHLNKPDTKWTKKQNKKKQLRTFSIKRRKWNLVKKYFFCNSQGETRSCKNSFSKIFFDFMPVVASCLASLSDTLVSDTFLWVTAGR